jgi:hypothetical protein
MIIDYKTDPDRAKLFRVVDAAGAELPPLWYADDEKAIYRAYDMDGHGCPAVRVVDSPSRDAFDSRGMLGVLEIAWTEYYCPLRIVAREDLSEADGERARRILAGQE